MCVMQSILFVPFFCARVQYTYYDIRKEFVARGGCMEMHRSLQAFSVGPDPSKKGSRSCATNFCYCYQTAAAAAAPVRVTQPFVNPIESMHDVPALRYSQGALGTALKCDLRLSLAVSMNATLSRGVFPKLERGKKRQMSLISATLGVRAQHTRGTDDRTRLTEFILPCR